MYNKRMATSYTEMKQLQRAATIAGFSFVVGAMFGASLILALS